MIFEYCCYELRCTEIRMLHSSANLSTETLRSEKSVQIIYNIAVDLLFAEQEKSAVVFFGFYLDRVSTMSIPKFNPHKRIR